MVRKNIVLANFVLAVCLIILLSANVSNAQPCLTSNITLTNNSNFVCTSGWIKVTTPTTLQNSNLTAKGIIINNTFTLKGASLLNVSEFLNYGNTTLQSNVPKGYSLVNEGFITLKRPIFLNFTIFINNGKIIDRNYIGNGGNSSGYSFGEGGSFPDSYAGSGAASIGREDSADNGGRTLVAGGEAYNLCQGGCGRLPSPFNVSGRNVSELLLNYTFNLSLLNSAGGADFNGNGSSVVNGGSGVFPLVIISKEFTNNGLITDEGQSINYSNVPDWKWALTGGIVGPGSGGVIQSISGSFLSNGTMNVSGGRVYLSKSMNKSLGFTSPYIYNLSELAHGGSGRVFFFKATKSLLLEALPAYNITISNTNSSTNGSISNTNKTVNVTWDRPKTYEVAADLAKNYGCGLEGISVNLTPDGSNKTYTFNLSHYIIFNSISKYATLSVYGDSPILNYYQKTENVSLNNQSYYFPGAGDLAVGININASGNFTSVMNSANETQTSTSKNLEIFLPIGRYNLTLNGSGTLYNYSFYVSQNCMGRENITLLPGKAYYDYNGMTIPLYFYTKTIYRTRTINNSVGSTYYSIKNYGNENSSQLLRLDYKILDYLSSINTSVLGKSQKYNYSTLLEELNASKPADNRSNSALDISLYQSGLDMYTSYNTGKVIKDQFVMPGNSASINLSYGNSTIEIALSKPDSQSTLSQFETGAIKFIEYIPSAFMGLLGGL